MPELPEVETVRRTLLPLIQGKTVRDIDVFVEKMVRNVTIKELQDRLIGQTIQSIGRKGKHLLLTFDTDILISHLRMEGKYFITPLEQNKNKHEHVIFYFNDDTTLRYHDVRKFGTFDLYKQDDIKKATPLIHLGPEPNELEFTKEYLYNRFQSKTVAVKSALLDQHIISGLGNIYANEVLFAAKIHPVTPCNKLTLQDCENIVNYSNRIIENAIKQGGTTIRSYTNSLGVTGRFQFELKVHGKEDEECNSCRRTIKKIKVGGRGTYYCPTCQKEK